MVCANGVRDVRDRGGATVNIQKDVGNLPNVAPVTRLSAIPEDPAGGADGDGYADLEEWLHQMALDLKDNGA